jgi:hypothetical protein
MKLHITYFPRVYQREAVPAVSISGLPATRQENKNNH